MISGCILACKLWGIHWIRAYTVWMAAINALPSNNIVCNRCGLGNSFVSVEKCTKKEDREQELELELEVESSKRMCNITCSLRESVSSWN
jgi:hypothetical protein